MELNNILECWMLHKYRSRSCEHPKMENLDKKKYCSSLYTSIMISNMSLRKSYLQQKCTKSPYLDPHFGPPCPPWDPQGGGIGPYGKLQYIYGYHIHEPFAQDALKHQEMKIILALIQCIILLCLQCTKFGLQQNGRLPFATTSYSWGCIVKRLCCIQSPGQNITTICGTEKSPT